MIIRERSGGLRTLVAIRGSIVPKILPQIATMFALGAVVAMARSIEWVNPGSEGVAPMALLGLALSIFLGFRNYAAYGRSWEARKQWGLLITEIRALLQAGTCFLPSERPARRAASLRLHFAAATDCLSLLLSAAVRVGRRRRLGDPGAAH